MPLVGIGHLTMLDTAPPDWVSLAHDAGFDAVGIRAAVIHHQDMRRALGLPRVVPEKRVRAALDVVLTPRGSTNLGSCQRAAGLLLRADDIDWSWGSGPEVTGPAEAILMAVAGRPTALADLFGFEHSIAAA